MAYVEKGRVNITRPRRWADGTKLRKKNAQGILEYQVSIRSARFDSESHSWMYTLNDWKYQPIAGETAESMLEGGPTISQLASAATLPQYPFGLDYECEDKELDPNLQGPLQREGSDEESEVHSIEAPSIFSDITISSTSTLAEIQGAAKEFAEVLFADKTLKPLYITALQRIDLQRLKRNFTRLFKSYAKDLRAEATTVSERTAVRFARTHAQSVAFHLFTRIEPYWNARNLEKHLLSQDNEIQPHSEISDDSESDEATRPDLFDLGEVKSFMTNSSAFARLKENFRNFVAPVPEDKGTEQVNRELEGEQPAIGSSSTDPILLIGSFDFSKPNTSAGRETSRRENANLSETITPPFAAREPSLHAARPTATFSNYALVIVSNIFQVFLNSLMPHAYNYLQDMVLNIIQCFSPFEPTLLEHSVRLRWTCGCGNSFFQDYMSSDLPSARHLRNSLLSSGYHAALFVNPGDSQAPEFTSGDNGAYLTLARNDNNKNASSSFDRPEDRGVEATSVNMIDSADVPENCSGTKAMWVLLCFYHNRHVSKAVHLDIKEEYDDVVLTKLFWEKYYQTRGWFAYYIFWKAVTNISFVKFQYILDPYIGEGRALLDDDWVPPQGWKDGRYWKPCPAEPRPKMQQWMLHMWSHPHNSPTFLRIQQFKLWLQHWAADLVRHLGVAKSNCARWVRQFLHHFGHWRGYITAPEQLPSTNPEIWLQPLDELDRSIHAMRLDPKVVRPGLYLSLNTPKRVEKQLKAHPDEPPLGWGLHFEEEFSLPAPLKYTMVFISIVVLLTAVVYAFDKVREKGVEAFSAGNFGIAIAAFIMTCTLKFL